MFVTIFFCIFSSLFCLVKATPLHLKVIKNSPYETKINLPKSSFVFYMSNITQGNFAFYTDKIHIRKNIRRIDNYEFDIERGIKIIIYCNDKFYYIRDGCNFIDFNSQCVGILACGFIFSFLGRRIKNQHKGLN